MQNIDASALAAAKAKLDAAEAQREEVLLRHIANGVDIRSRNVEIGSEVVIAPGAVKSALRCSFPQRLLWFP